MASPALDQLPHTIDSLPYGVISYPAQPEPRCAVAIGSHALDLSEYAKTDVLKDVLPSADSIFSEVSLNTFAALPWDQRKAVRSKIQDDLKNGRVASSCLVPLTEVKNHLPMRIGGYSDFYTSLEHVSRRWKLLDGD